MVDEYVLNQLSPEEKIEYEHKVGDTTWLATTKRVLKFKKSLVGDKSLRDLDYKHIVSINLEEKRYYELLILSGLSIMLGLVFNGSFLFLILAIIVGAIAIFYRHSYYQFIAPSINLEDWEMEDTETKQGKELIQTIRKYCFFEEKEKQNFGGLLHPTLRISFRNPCLTTFGR